MSVPKLFFTSVVTVSKLKDFLLSHTITFVFPKRFKASSSAGFSSTMALEAIGLTTANFENLSKQ